MEDIDYEASVSVAYLPITDPIHLPCPDMEGLINFDPIKAHRSCCLIAEIRKRHGLQQRVRVQPKPLTYVCTECGCIEPWGTVNNGNP
ncbi:hypothetical protein DTW68_24915 [Vibrio harveyi]|nr:hypothetical protein DTW68_24915 [Vibrio harveyi]